VLERGRREGDRMTGAKKGVKLGRALEKLRETMKKKESDRKKERQTD
jgi:hypothetical protein